MTKSLSMQDWAPAFAGEHSNQMSSSSSLRFAERQRSASSSASENALLQRRNLATSRRRSSLTLGEEAELAPSCDRQAAGLPPCPPHPVRYAVQKGSNCVQVEAYLESVCKTYASGSATEHSYRPALQALFAGIDPALSVINEPKKSEAGMPDFLFDRGGVEFIRDE